LIPSTGVGWRGLAESPTFPIPPHPSFL
jgi:hypothetical protein